MTRQHLRQLLQQYKNGNFSNQVEGGGGGGRNNCVSHVSKFIKIMSEAKAETEAEIGAETEAEAETEEEAEA